MKKGIVVTPENWKKLTEYVEDLPVSFYKAEKAVEVQNIFRTALMVDINEEEKK